VCSSDLTVLDGSPAMTAGLYADDEIVALDGLKCDAPGLVSRVEDRKPGEVVKVTLFRREKLLEVPVTVASKPADAVWLQRTERPTDFQKAAFQAWLGTPWTEVDAALNGSPLKV
jgi:predicted metalloprotease with PDZ domain